MQYVKEQLRNGVPASERVFEGIAAAKAKGAKVHDLSSFHSPFPVPEFAQNALRLNVDKGEYVETRGVLETRKAIVRYHSRMDDLNNFDPNDVIIGPGSAELAYLLLKVTSGDLYVPSPSWQDVNLHARFLGKTIHTIETQMERGWKIGPTILEKRLQAAKNGSVLMFCNPNNPTGVSYSEEELRALAVKIEKSNVIILSDETYGRLTYDRKHHSISKFLPERTVVSSGISDWAACGGWRFGYHMYPKELRPVLSAVTALASATYRCSTVPIQYAAMNIVKFGDEAREYRHHVVKILGAVAKYCHGVLTKAGVKAVQPEAAYFLYCDFEAFRGRLEARGVKTSTKMCASMLKEAGVALQPCPAFLQDDAKLRALLSFNNFDGKMALRGSRMLGTSGELDAEFVDMYCKDTVEAIDRVVQWLAGSSA